MFVKEEILAIPFPKAKSKADYLIRAETHTIGKQPTLCIHFYHSKKLTYSVYVQANKWINYIHEEKRFNKAMLLYSNYIVITVFQTKN